MMASEVIDPVLAVKPGMMSKCVVYPPLRVMDVGPVMAAHGDDGLAAGHDRHGPQQGQGTGCTRQDDPGPVHGVPPGVTMDTLPCQPGLWPG